VKIPLFDNQQPATSHQQPAISNQSPAWQFYIDRGGTFTDCLGRSPAGELHCVKVLSSDHAPLAGIRKILKLADEAPIPPCEVKMGTTIATNALLERKGRSHALLITRGFADVLQIGTQQRPDIFEIRVVKPSVLYQTVVEIDERIAANGEVLQPPDLRQIQQQLQTLRSQGLGNLAIVFLHGFAFPQHEKIVADLARSLGFQNISCSHEVCPEIGLTARGDTTTADAYLTPLLLTYLRTLENQLPASKLKMMQSSGGLIEANRFRGHNAILSGPAAGVVACARLGRWFGFPNIIGFDMGGTSTDVSRYDGEFERVYETVTAGVRIKAPMLSIHTVAAGGGSICKFVSGRLMVGPESAGANPGPLCYDLKDEMGNCKATELTTTDVNLFLGRLLPENFPFHLNRERVAEKVEAIHRQCLTEGLNLSAPQIAEGFLEVVNLNMAQAIKEISVARGHDVREYVLCCFGGAGGQHACAVARHLGIKKILLHPLAGVLSAYGIGLADTIWEGSSPVARLPLNENSLQQLEAEFQRLAQEGEKLVCGQGFLPAALRTVRKLDLRYVGTETPLTINEPPDRSYWREFAAKHRQLYGYVREGRGVEILQCRVEVIGVTDMAPPEENKSVEYAPAPARLAPVIFKNKEWQAAVFRREELTPGAVVHGPAIILEKIATIFVEPDFAASVDGFGNIILEQKEHEQTTHRLAPSTGTVDPIALEIFNNLFMSIAEQMGNVLRRTAISTNIKERLDFSCALFDAGGHLVANAPHIPVHLGAMGESVRSVLQAHTEMAPGDVFATNNPFGGGSHLPDITVVTPVFSKNDSTRPIFFTASRAHHAEIGGVTPGSMPPFSTRLEEEGVLLDNVKLVEAGKFTEALFADLFTAGKYPTRNLTDNRADLQAQMASNHTGVRLLEELVAHYGLETVLAYMRHVRDNAARQVREALRRIPAGSYHFQDAMDDGTPIAVRITIAGENATVDFTGTGKESEYNLNAPPAVVRAAVLYVFRCLVNERIPLNDGCIEPIRIIIPEKSIVNPTVGRAVVGGNVETSQRVVDVLLGALGLAAASQGTMNNLTFGDETFGYYETICGGAGAAENYHGASGVHTHMTNTRITDPEVLETRHPVRLLQFSIRPNSGGKGRWHGGDGVIRYFKFLKDLKISLLSQRRRVAPFGLNNGEAGKVGENIRVRVNGARVQLEGNASYQAERGEELMICTPGGGGWGN
jgi:5-oxoprolinase (ATP-hydrolysing)